MKGTELLSERKIRVMNYGRTVLNFFRERMRLDFITFCLETGNRNKIATKKRHNLFLVISPIYDDCAAGILLRNFNILVVALST